MSKKIYDPNTGLVFDPETGELTPASGHQGNSASGSESARTTENSASEDNPVATAIGGLLALGAIYFVVMYWKHLLGSTVIIFLCIGGALAITRNRDDSDAGRWAALMAALLLGGWGAWTWWGYVSKPSNEVTAQAAHAHLATFEGCTNINVRAAPGINSSVLFVLPCSTSVLTDNLQEVAESGSGKASWTKITSEGRTGWVRTKFVRIVSTGKQ